MKAELVEILRHLAAYYKETLSPLQLAMYAEDLSVLSPEELVHAVKTYRNDPANNFFPLPAKLISVVKPVETELDVARLAAGRIMTAVSKFGHTNPERAREYIGELGWEVIKLQGGWRSICGLSTEDLKGEQPRMRDLAISVSKRSKAGMHDQAPELPKPIQKQIQSDVSNLISQVTKRMAIGQGVE